MDLEDELTWANKLKPMGILEQLGYTKRVTKSRRSMIIVTKLTVQLGLLLQTDPSVLYYSDWNDDFMSRILPKSWSTKFSQQIELTPVKRDRWRPPLVLYNPRLKETTSSLIKHILKREHTLLYHTIKFIQKQCVIGTWIVKLRDLQVICKNKWFLLL